MLKKIRINGRYLSYIMILFVCLSVIMSQTALAATMTVSSVANFNTELSAAVDNDVLMLDGGFLSDLSSTATVGVNAVIPGGDSRNLIIDGGNQVYTPNSGFGGTLFSLTHNGTGTLTIQNMTIKSSPGACFRLAGSGKVKFDNVTFEDNRNVSISNGLVGSLVIENCNFTANKDQAIGDEGNSSVGHQITVNNSYFFENNAGYGAAMGLGSGGRFTITKSTFIDNEGAGNGYAGGAICINQKRDFNLDIDHCYFSGNTIYGNVGGAIAFYRVINGTGKITNSVFEQNKSLGSSSICDGGAIAVKNNSSGLSAVLEISGCNFIANYSYDNGGAILLEASNGGITTSTLYNCTFAYNDGAASAAAFGGYGGAVQLYDTTNTKFFFNTFYKNKTSKGWFGAAIGVNKGFPEIINNIFMDNKTNLNNNYKNIYFAGGSENVAMNNGNIGYDNGRDFVPGDAARNAEVTSKNTFKNFYTSGDLIPSYAAVGEAKPVIFDVPVGADGHTTSRVCYIITPLTDEMFRTNSRTVDTGIYTDVRGFPREKIVVGSTTFPYYPNAGAVEIYWTKFDPGMGSWNSNFDIAGVLGAVKTLIVGSESYYIVADPPIMTGGVPQYSSAYAFPRDTLQGPTDYGFLYWENDKTGEYKAVNELYYSQKQTYVAQWKANQFHVDFNLNGGTTVSPSHFETQIIINGVNNNLATQPLSEPTFSGYEFEGWYSNRTFTGEPWNFFTNQVFADVTLYAKWNYTGIIVTPSLPTTPTPSSGPIPSFSPIPTESGDTIINNNVSEDILIPPDILLPLESAIPTYTPSVMKIEDEQINESTNEVPITGEKIIVAVIITALLASAGIKVSMMKHKKQKKK